MAKAIAGCFPFRESDRSDRLALSVDMGDIRATIRRRPELVERFYSCLMAYVVDGDPHAAPQYFISATEDQVATILRHGGELFVMGHEYGHVILGHLLSERKAADPLGDASTEPITEYMPSWGMELEADVMGLQLLIAAQQSRGYDLPLACLGAAFFLATVAAIELTMALLRTGDLDAAVALLVEHPSSTHPPPLLRWQSMSEILRRSVHGEAADAACMLADTTVDTTMLLMESAAPIMLRARDAGVRPSDRWRA